ncbi:phage tail tape measure protein [Brachybacterium sp. SGAir0954]|uniref:phage tail tape measure protein n=1 Tax=Brachybacterium sp. SGAir0954 TaxID=2571029 RepID=UPI0010CD03A3|nr:phage tail tape measure protein [Brachybacterium sp. SGAir0954]QCR53204.1 phage tail tape measure protein [Brachybacterium sp. SGAir0954]
MADRSVKVRLEADVQGFVAKMKTAQQSVADFAKRSGEQGGKALDWVGNHKDSINDVSNGFLGAGAVLTGFAGIAVKSAADFDSAMSSVQAATMAPKAEMDQLRQAALDAGADTKYSATEAAGAIEELAKAGVSTADILNGGLSGALDLAASDNIEVADAAEIASSAMTQFGLAGEDVTHIADLLAAGAGKAQGGVQDLGYALQQGGLVASQMGLSIEETVGGLTAFASAGLMGSDAGTSFKTMLQRLANPSEKAAQQMSDLGINAYDAQGNFVGLAEFSGQLQTAMQDLTPEARNAAMSIIFGSDAIRGANVLYSEGEAGIRDWITAVDDQGFAAEQASTRMDNLAGDLEQMRGALETAFIGAGDGADSVLRPLVQTITNLIDAFNGLPDAAKQALGTGTGIAGLSLLAIGGLGKALNSVADLKGSLKDLGIATEGVGRKMKLLGAATVAGLAITGLTMAIGAYFESVAEAQGRTDELADSLDKLTGEATSATSETIISQLSDQLDEGDWEALEKIGLSQADLAAAVLEGGDAYEAAKSKLDEYALAQDGVTASGQNAEAAYAKASDAIAEQNAALEEGRDKAQQNAAAQEELAGSSEMSAEAQQALQGAIEETGVSLDGVIEDMETFLELLFATGLATMSTRDAQSAYQESIAGVSDTIKAIQEDMGGLGEALNESRTDFDLTTEAGREANGAFQDIAQSGFDVATAMGEAGASQEEIQGSLQGTYNSLVSAAGQFGITGKAAEDLAREVLGIPDGVSIESWMSSAAEEQAHQTSRAVDGIDRTVTVTTIFVTKGSPPKVSPNGTRTATVYADGGVSLPRVKAFASGAENHVAQIAPAGAWRLWAEPETGGEAYIPLSSAKRGRSTAILSDVASRFGYQLMQAADGLVLPYQPRQNAMAGATQARASMTYAPTINGSDPQEVAEISYQKFQHWTVTESTGYRGA